MKLYRVLFSASLLVATIIIWVTNTPSIQGQAQQTLLLSQNLTQTVQAMLITPIPTSTVVPSPTSDKIGPMETQVVDLRLKKLENELKKIETPQANISFAPLDMGAICSGLIWPLLLLLALLLYKKHFESILSELPSKLKRSNIKYGDLELTDSDIERVILHREQLKAMLAVSMADSVADPQELKFIEGLSHDMNDKLDVLGEDAKKSVLSAAIKLALIDGTFADDEYDEILKKAQDYKIEKVELDKMVKKACKDANKKTPTKAGP